MNKESGTEKRICPGCGREVRKERCIYCGTVVEEEVQRAKEGSLTMTVAESIIDGEGSGLSSELRENVEGALRRGQGSVLEECTLVTEHEAGGVEEGGRSVAKKILRLLEGMKKEGLDTPGVKVLSRTVTIDLILEAMRGMARDEQLRFVAGELESSAFSSYINEEIRGEILSRLLQGGKI
jgi:hypothetical protein